jgi:hypothetical protein
MARVVSTPFQGVPPRDVLADASIYQRVIRRALGELAEIKDRLTGENGNAVTIDHSGSGRGCPLGLAIANQTMDARIDLTDTGAALDADFYIIAVPVFVAAGEGQSWTLEVDVTDGMSRVVGNTADSDVYAEVRDASWALNLGPVAGRRSIGSDISATRPINDGSAPPRVISDEAQAGQLTELPMWSWNITLGAGLQYVLVKRYCAIEERDPNARLAGWRLFPDRRYADRPGVDDVVPTIAGSQYPAATTFVPGTWTEFWDSQIEIEGPLDAYVTSRANRNINTLWEWMTGSKIPGNLDFIVASTRNNNRVSFTAEPQLDLPIACLALGGTSVDTSIVKFPVSPFTITPTSGLLWWTRYPTTQPGAGAKSMVASAHLQMPSFDDVTSNLKCTMLVTAPDSDSLAGWRLSVTGSTAVAFTQLGTSDYWIATATAIPYAASTIVSHTVNLHHTTIGALTAELVCLGVCFYFEAP